MSTDFDDALRAFPNPIPSDRPRCPNCGGDLDSVKLGRLEEHRKGCPRFPR